MLSSHERGYLRWGFRCLFSGSSTTVAIRRAARRPTGVEEHGQMDARVPQELGSPRHSHGKIPGWSTGLPTPGSSSRRWWRWEKRNEPPAARGIAERRNSQRGETDGRESECLESTVEGGELVLNEDPLQGSETSHQTTAVVTYVRCSETWKAYQRNSSG